MASLHMADGSQFHNTASRKRGRTDDLLELASKRQRIDVEDDTDEFARRETMIQNFTQFIGNRDIAAEYVQLFLRRGPCTTPYVNCPSGFDGILNGMYSQSLNPTNTKILFGILNGLVPGYTVGGGTNIWTYMTDEAYQLLKNFLITSYHYLQKGLPQIQLPPPPFQQAFGSIGGSTPNLFSQQLVPLEFVWPEVHPQAFSNGASYPGMISQQPFTSWGQGQFADPNARFVPSHPQPHHLTGAQTMQGLNPQVPQARPARPFPNLSPQAKRFQQEIQQQYRTLQQQQQQATRMSLRQPQAIVETRSLPMPTTAGNHTPPPQIAEVTQQRSTPPSHDQSSSVNPGAAQGAYKKTRKRVKVIGDGTPGSSSMGLQIPEPINKRAISDSAVHHNQHLGQIINPVNNGLDVVPRSQTASGYHTNQYPSLVNMHSFFTSPISPIPTQSIGNTNCGSTPLYDIVPNSFGVDPQADLGWVHQPQSRGRKKAGTAQSGGNLTFIMMDGQKATKKNDVDDQTKTTENDKTKIIENDKTKNDVPRPKRQAGSSKAKAKPVVQAIREEEEEEEEEQTAHQNLNNDATAAAETGVESFSFPPTLHPHPAPAPQTVNDADFPSSFPQFRTEAETSPEQQERYQAQQRFGNGATTPIIPLSIPGAIPSSEAPQASTSSSLAYPHPVIAVSNAGLSFGSPSLSFDDYFKGGVFEPEEDEFLNSRYSGLFH